MLSASVSCADPSWGPGLHRDELRQTGRSPAPAIGQERSIADSPQSGHMRETASTGTSARRAASCAASARWAAATKEMGLLPEHGGPRRS